MTIKQLIEMCVNICADDYSIMIYHSLEDFELFTSNWDCSKIYNLTSSELETEIVKFQIMPYSATVAVARA